MLRLPKYFWAPHACSACRGQKVASDPLTLKFEMAVSGHMGARNGIRSSGRAALRDGSSEPSLQAWCNRGLKCLSVQSVSASWVFSVLGLDGRTTWLPAAFCHSGCHKQGPRIQVRFCTFCKHEKIRQWQNKLKQNKAKIQPDAHMENELKTQHSQAVSKDYLTL